MNPIMIVRIILIGAVLSFFTWVAYIYNDRADEKEARITAEDIAKKSSETINQMKLNRELENFARTQYIDQLEASKRENQRIEKCIADRTCVATVRVRVPAVCAGTGAGDSAGAQEFAAELTPDAARVRANLQSNIADWEAYGKFCKKTLENWETKKSR